MTELESIKKNKIIMEELLETKETETSAKIEDSEVIEVINYWTCDVCDGNSDTGCLMSDPQNCVRE